MSGKSERLSGHFEEEFLLPSSYGADGSGPELESVRKEVWEQGVWCSSHSGHGAQGPPFYATWGHLQWRKPSVTSIARWLSICLFLHLVLNLCANTAMIAILEFLHELRNMVFSSPGLISYLVSFPRCTLQSCGDTLTMSVLFQHWRGSVLIPSEWTHILGQICPPAHKCLFLYHQLQTHRVLFPWPHCSTKHFLPHWAGKGLCPENSWFYLSPSWPRSSHITSSDTTPCKVQCYRYIYR